MTYTITPTGPRIDIRALRNSVDGRALLVKEGLWTADKAERRRKQMNSKSSKTKSGPFVGWDGEGVAVQGRHRYVMLCNQFGTQLKNRKGIDTYSALATLCQYDRDHPGCNHVMYGGSYDANMMLGDLTRYECTELAETGVTFWQGFRIEYRPRKYLRITQYETGQRRSKHTKMSSVTIWDVIGFFQMSFVKACSGWLSSDAEVMPFIESMKQSRSLFKLSDMDEMERYCVEECKLLSKLMSKLRNHMRVVGLVPPRWDGAGAIGATMLRKHALRDCKGDSPLPVQTAAQHAYFGGRIESVQFGNHEQKCYGHDIVSAYPSAAVDLPCLAHGTWEQREPREGENGILHLVWESERLDEPFYPLPWRQTDGAVYFPYAGDGWYWQSEANAAYEYYQHFSGRLDIMDAWTWKPDCNHAPFSFIPGRFLQRAKYKANGNLAEKVLKLALNSVYGKLAQQVGSKDGNPPAFHQIEWAGIITSKTRAAMLLLALEEPTAVIAFETDGMYATKRFRPDGDKSLGSWEVSEYDGITYVQSGVYWTRTNDQWGAKYRGFDPDSVIRDAVLQSWRNGIWGNDFRYPPDIRARSTRFQGMMTSVVSPEQFVGWRQWRTDERVLKPYPHGKRMIDPGMASDPATSLCRTIATGGPKVGNPALSTIHKLAWKDDPTIKTLDDRYYLRDMALDEEGEEVLP